MESLAPSTTRLTLDMDVFDDPTHGARQLTFFHGFYYQYQYQARVITRAENDQVVLPCLLHGAAPVAMGDDDITRVIHKLRARFPDIVVAYRADAGFASPVMYEALEAIPSVIYAIGFQMTSVPRAKSADLWKAAENLKFIGRDRRADQAIHALSTWLRAVEEAF